MRERYWKTTGRLPSPESQLVNSQVVSSPCMLLCGLLFLTKSVVIYKPYGTQCLNLMLICLSPRCTIYWYACVCEYVVWLRSGTESRFLTTAKSWMGRSCSRPWFRPWLRCRNNNWYIHDNILSQAMNVGLEKLCCILRLAVLLYACGICFAFMKSFLSWIHGWA